MEPRVIRPVFRAQYMFGLLDYETWIVWSGAEHLGVVTLNTRDHDVIFTPDEPVKPAAIALLDHSYDWWYVWVQLHEPR